MLRQIEDAFLKLWHDVIERVPNILAAIVVVLVFWGLSKLGASVIHRIASRTDMAPNLTELLVRIGSFLVITFGVIFGAIIVFPAFIVGDLFAGLGLSSVAIGFAFKDILQNFFAGIFLLWRQPFKVGDEIVAGQFRGKVEEITARATLIRTYSGERAVIPNADVFTEALLVLTAFGKRRSTFRVGIGYYDSIDKARDAITHVLNTTDGVEKDPGPWVYVSELADSAVNFTVYFWTDDTEKEVLRVSDRVATGIKQALDAASIDMPYPHEVVILRHQERQEKPIPTPHRGER